ncbi:LANO_0H17348g1_1 [Lachancea nothofagi CBS 11611]|uniref:LANO_0H17348g1_1 n=1 Tax=Lachancea nothofagi CBS 11611 TaxID=1266666 RepID=A0A1G4KMZ7_9SACH|nr:LANO_0H17348g1_1 [Lachancea nothofagi CBS 11611]
MWKAIIDALNGDEGKLNNGDGQNYDFSQVKSFVSSGDSSKTLIDVREPNEYAEGHIPGSSNMPFRSHPLALRIPSREFEKDFGFQKPDKNQELVLLCASGRRASQSREEALKAGYKQVSVYPGSMSDWVAKGGKTI